MIKYTITMNPDKTLHCIKQKGKKTEELNEKQTVWAMYKIPKRGVKITSNDFLRNTMPSYNIIGNGHNYNISIEKKHFSEIWDRAAKLEKEFRNKIKKTVTIGAATTAAVATIGVGAAAVMHLTSGEEYDPTVDSEYSEEQLMENTQAIPVIDEETASMYAAAGPEHAAQFVELNTNRAYEEGIKERNEPFVDLLQRKENKWGVGYELLYDILSQEYGGEEQNIYHIVFNSWKDQVIKAYNFDTEKYEKIVLTDTPENYEKILADGSNANKPNTVNQIISREDLNSPEVSAGVECQVVHFGTDYFKGNLNLGILANNWGVGNVKKLLNYTSEMTGYSVEDLIAQQNGLIWLNYVDEVELETEVDRHYYEHVCRHISEQDENYNYYYINTPVLDENGNVLYDENGRSLRERNEIRVDLIGQLTDTLDRPIIR